MVIQSGRQFLTLTVNSEAPIRYATFSKVLDVAERVTRKWQRGSGNDAIFVEKSLGYYALFEGSFEAIHLGFDPPAFRVGDKVKITFEKVFQCQASPNTNQPNS